MKLGKDVFIALAAIAWADGEVAESEASALIAGARASGLTNADLDAVDIALRSPTGLTRVSSLALSADEREFVYTIATWLTRIDGVVTDEETAALVKLGDLLHLDDSARERGAIAAAVIGGYPGAAGAQDVLALAREIERAAHEA